MNKAVSFYEPGVPMAIAHRGGIIEAQLQGLDENTIAAFEYVINHLQYQYVETDVRATKDGSLYVWHGKGLERLQSHRSFDLSRLHRRDVQSIRSHGAPLVPLLGEVLETFPTTRFFIDPKHWPAVEPLVSTLITTNSLSRVAVTSFSDKRTIAIATRVRALTGQQLYTGIGPRGMALLSAHQFFSRRDSRWLNHYLVAAPYQLLSRARIQAAKAAKLHVIAWTVNDAATMRMMLLKGVDGIITDRPSLLTQVIADLGLPLLSHSR
jgi:glycerophosphoryl diester phosphodiesterase